jgi:hypothetical protein
VKPRLENLQRSLQTEAERWQSRAEDARTPALREYYVGRAEGLRNAADSLEKFTYGHTTNPSVHADD